MEPCYNGKKTYLRFLALLEEFLLPFALLHLLTCEVSIFADVVHGLLIDSLQVDLRARCDNITGINPPERHAIDFVRTSDEENALGEMFEEDHALATEATGKKNENGARRECRTGSGGANRFADLCSQRVSMSLRNRPLRVHALWATDALRFLFAPCVIKMCMKSVFGGAP